MFGNILLTLGLLFAVFTVVTYYLSYRGYQNTLNLARLSYHGMAVTVVAASAMLLHSILTHQYQYKYVYNYSGSDLPVGLLMSTFYAGQEGSFMIWLLLTAVVGIILLDYTSKRGDLEPRVMMIYSLTAVFLLIMVNPLLKSPFTYIWADPTFISVKKINQAYLSMPFLKNFLFSDPESGNAFIQMSAELMGVLKAQGIAIKDFIIQGKGLNPLLQNFWMQIHPPMLFVGFTMSAVPFSFAFAAMMKNDYRDWVRQSLPWVLSGTMILGLAIMLGGYWAYGVLGWGGYWGWDPVENSSLVPWLIGVASVHTLLVQRKTQSRDSDGKFARLNLVLCIMTYVLVLYSTFLTRSGILGDASVHSFVDPGMTVYLLLIVFVSVFTLLGVGAVVYRWKSINENVKKKESFLSRELSLFTGAVALIASAIIVLVGTSTPIFGSSVEISFYNEMNLPIAIIIGFLNGLSLLLKWKTTEGKNVIRKSKFSIGATLAVTLLVALIGGTTDIMLILLTLATAFALFVNIEIAYKIFKGRKSHLGAYIAHAGISIFLLGVVATGGFTMDKQVDLARGEKVSVLGHELTYTGYELIENGKKYAFNIEVVKGEKQMKVAPIMYIADFNNSLMREPDILSRLTRDFYISPMSYNDGKGESTVDLTRGEITNYKQASIRFDDFNFPPEAMASMQAGNEFFIGTKLTVQHEGETYNVEPKMVSDGTKRTFEPALIEEANLKIELLNLDASGKVSLRFGEIDMGEEEAPKEVLSIEASIKPFVNLVWLGVIVMVIGFIVAASRRAKESLK